VTASRVPPARAHANVGRPQVSLASLARAISSRSVPALLLCRRRGAFCQSASELSSFASSPFPPPLLLKRSRVYSSGQSACALDSSQRPLLSAGHGPRRSARACDRERQVVRRCEMSDSEWLQALPVRQIVFATFMRTWATKTNRCGGNEHVGKVPRWNSPCRRRARSDPPPHRERRAKPPPHDLQGRFLVFG